MRTIRTFLSVASISLALAITFTACEGPAGEDGKTPEITIGSNGNWFIDGEDTGEKAVGEKGDTPEVSISDDGFWIIDGDTTNVKAKGEKGENGVCIPCQNGSSSSVTPSSSSVGCPEYNSATHFCDERDYQIYGYKLIGELVWMTENLRYYNPEWPLNNTGATPVPAVNDKGSWCINNDPENCADKRGRSYTWYAAMDDACPSGWHLPSRTEFLALANEADGVGNGNTSIPMLKSETGWSGDYNNGTDELGFSALPGGTRMTSGAYETSNHPRWWSSTQANTDTQTHSYVLYFSSPTVLRIDERGFNSGLKIRCVKDDEN